MPNLKLVPFSTAMTLGEARNRIHLILTGNIIHAMLHHPLQNFPKECLLIRNQVH